MGEVEFFVGQEALVLGILGGSVLTVDMDGLVKKIRVTYGFGLQVMCVGSLGVTGPCTLQISFRP